MEYKGVFLGWEDALEKEIATHSDSLPGKSHGQRSLAGYSSWSHKELDMTEHIIVSNTVDGTLLKFTIRFISMS